VTVSRRPFYGPWIIAASFVTFGLASGLPYYNIAFFYDYLRDDHHWTQQMVTLGAPVAILLTIWAGPLLAPRFNPRYLIVAGTGLTCLAFQWFGHLHGSSLEYYAAWCVYMLGYLLSGPIPHQIIISNWYRRNRGKAMGIAYIGGALAGAIGNKLAPWLVSFMPYRSALQILGLRCFWPGRIALFVMKDRPEDLGQHPDGDDAPSRAALDTAPALTFAELSSRSSFWLLLVGSAASIGSIASVNFLMKFVFEEQGFTKPGRPRPDLEHRVVCGADCRHCGADRRRLAGGPHVAQDRHGLHVRAGGGRDSIVVLVTPETPPVRRTSSASCSASPWAQITC
jgi:MFS family permease